MSHLRRSLELLVYVSALIAIELLLVQLGHGPLAMPWATGQSWTNWSNQTDYATMVFASARLCALLVTLYLIATTLLLSWASIMQWKRLVRFASALATPFSRRVIERTLGLSLVGALALPSVVQAAPVADDVPTMRVLAPGEINPAFATPPNTAPVTTPVTVPAAPVPVIDLRSTHTVVKGENLWTIAEAQLKTQLDHAPNDEETRAYWLDLMEANRSELTNPGLIQPGQTLLLPHLKP